MMTISETEKLLLKVLRLDDRGDISDISITFNFAAGQLPTATVCFPIIERDENFENFLNSLYKNYNLVPVEEIKE